MRHRKLGAVGFALALGTAMALGLPGGAVAASSGMVPASGKTVKAMVKDMGLQVPAKCLSAKQARSNRSWAAISGKSGPGCNPGDGYSVAQRANGKWKALPIGGSYVTCSDLKSKLAKAGAPKSVFRDFKAAKFCVKGE